MLWSKPRKPRSSALKSGTWSLENLHSSLCWSRVSSSFHSTLFKNLCCLIIVRPNTQTSRSSWSTEMKPLQLCDPQRQHYAWTDRRPQKSALSSSQPALKPAAGAAALPLRARTSPSVLQHRNWETTSPPHGTDGWRYRQAGREHTSSHWVSPKKCSWHKASAFANELFRDN